MGGFGDLLGGLFGLFGDGAVEATAGVAVEAFTDEPGREGDADELGGTRYLAGGPRMLNINDI